MQKNLLIERLVFVRFFVITYSIYVFFTPLLIYKFDSIIKVVFLVLWLLSLILYVLFNIRANLSFDYLLVLVFPSLYVFALAFSWTNFSEVNLVLTPLIGYILAKDSSFFKKVLVVVFWLQLFAVLYELASGEYIFTSFTAGLLSGSDRILDASAYGNVGFRPKGIFSGPLDATSFCIFIAIIFRNNRLFLLFVLSLALATNGRLAILCVSFVLLFQYRKNIGLILFFATILFIYLILQSDEAINNLLRVFNFSDGSNYYRLSFMYNGLVSYFQYDVNNLIFGDSGFYTINNEHGAESGMLNILLNIGFLGFAFYSLYFLRCFLVVVNVRSSGIYIICLFLLFLSLGVYRIEAGFFRGGMLWFVLFYIIMTVRSKGGSHA